MSHPVSYRIPKDVYGDELVQIHKRALEVLKDADWQGTTEKQRSGNYKLFAERFHELHFVFFSFRFYDFLLATVHEIDPAKKYGEGSPLVFRVSDVPATLLMNVRWIEDAHDPAFQKVKEFFEEYIRALDRVFQNIK